MNTSYSIHTGRSVIFNDEEGIVLHRFRYQDSHPNFDTVGNFYVVGFPGGVRVCFEGHLYPVPSPQEVQKLAETRAEALCAKKAKRLAKEHGICLELLHDDGLSSENWVYPPEGVFTSGTTEDALLPIDPFDGNHAAYDWAETLHHVETYVKLFEELGLTTV